MSNEENGRFELTVERIKRLQEEQPLRRGADPMETSPDLVRAVAEAADIFQVERLAVAIGMGRTTIRSWMKRAAIEDAGESTTGFGADSEIEVLIACVRVLSTLDSDGRHRVLNYLDERFFGRAKVK